MSGPVELLVLGTLAPEVMEDLDRRYCLHRADISAHPESLIAALGPTVRGVVTTGGPGCSAAVMEQLPKLEIISCMAVGLDAVDLLAAKRRGVHVAYTPDVLNDCVADLAMGLVIAGMRQIVSADRYVRAGRWLEQPMPLATSLRGKRLGILGLGRIGLEIARRAEPFKLQIGYHNRQKRSDVTYEYAADPVALASQSDVFVVVTPGGSGSRHLVNRKVMDALGPNGLLVNVARGSVVDEVALISALAEGRLGAAALDVFADEPRVPAALLALPNVIVVPHIGSATKETRFAMGRLVVDNLDAYFAGRPLLTPAH